MIVGFLALLGCPADPPTPAVSPPTPEDPGPPLDTGLPPIQPPPVPPFAMSLGEPVVCGDIGRDTRFYDRQEWGEAPAPDDRMWHSSGLLIDDFDGDGGFEVIAPSRDGTAYWDITDDGWIEGSAAAFVGLDLTSGVGGSVADFDGDGDPDVYITRFGVPDVLLSNEGGAFVDVSAQAGIPSVDRRSTSASWGDFDGDGWLDLFVGGYGEAPESAYATNMIPGDPSLLLRNRGNGTFEDVSAQIPSEVHDGYTFGSAFYDVDEDGLPELFVIQDFGWVRPSTLFWNRGGVFERDDGTAGFHPNFAGMGLAVGDINGDGLPDFAQSSYEILSLLISQRTALATEGVVWAESSETLGVTVDLPTRHQVFGWGTDFGDLDNDADLDLVMGFGRWDEYQNYEWQYDGTWLRDGNQFTHRAGTTHWKTDDRRSTRGVLLVDLDRDGWLDIAKRMLDAPIVVHTSRCSISRHWLRVHLEDPASPNHRAIGARVTLHAGPVVQTRWVQAGSSSMFSGGPPELLFGLGEERIVDRIEVRWPDGELEVAEVELAADRDLAITRSAP